MSMNMVCVTGRLVADPELKYTTSGIPVASMRIAVNRITKKEDGGYESDFFNVTAWQKTAEFASTYLTRGRLVSIVGRLQERRWVDQASGQKRSVVEIVASQIEGLDKKPEDGGEAHTPAPQTQRSAQVKPRAAAQAHADSGYQDDDSDPFSDE